MFLFKMNVDGNRQEEFCQAEREEVGGNRKNCFNNYSKGQIKCLELVNEGKKVIVTSKQNTKELQRYLKL